MPVTIAFLRAINVGGHTIKMDVLRQIFLNLGLLNVETFIASGNVIFETPPDPAEQLEARIAHTLQENLGYPVSVFLRNQAQLAAIASYQPFSQASLGAAAALNLAFLSESLDSGAEERLLALKTNIDDFQHHQREIYWLCTKKQSESSISNAVLEKAIGRPCTLRGISTVGKLAAKYAAPIA